MLYNLRCDSFSDRITNKRQKGSTNNENKTSGSTVRPPHQRETLQIHPHRAPCGNSYHRNPGGHAPASAEFRKKNSPQNLLRIKSETDRSCFRCIPERFQRLCHAADSFGLLLADSGTSLFHQIPLAVFIRNKIYECENFFNRNRCRQRLLKHIPLSGRPLNILKPPQLCRRRNLGVRPVKSNNGQSAVACIHVL